MFPGPEGSLCIKLVLSHSLLCLSPLILVRRLETDTGTSQQHRSATVGTFGVFTYLKENNH